jgi:hypothetical protein
MSELMLTMCLASFSYCDKYENNIDIQSNCVNYAAKVCESLNESDIRKDYNAYLASLIKENK